MSEAFEVIKAIEFGYQYQVNCELTPEQCKRILDWIEKWHKCQSLACKQEARIAELEELDKNLCETIEQMRYTIVSLSAGESVKFDLHCSKCGKETKILHPVAIEGEYEFELKQRITELEERIKELYADNEAGKSIILTL